MNRHFGLTAILTQFTRLALLKLFLVFSLLACTSLAHAEVALPNGEYSETLEEFRVQALGGPVRITREYYKERWQINSRWAPLSFEQDALDGSVKNINQNGTPYTRIGDAWRFGKRNLIRAQAVSVLTPGADEGLKLVSGGGSSVEFEDSNNEIDPGVFNGNFSLQSLGLGFLGWSRIQLGGAISAPTRMPSFIWGFDVSIAALKGKSKVTYSHVKFCDCESLFIQDPCKDCASWAEATNKPCACDTRLFD